MFVSKNRVIVKTCGSTTLLNCLEEILQIVKRAGFESVEVCFACSLGLVDVDTYLFSCTQDVFYSHKNLLVPSLQLPPHHSFLKESDYLDKAFNGKGGTFILVNTELSFDSILFRPVASLWTRQLRPFLPVHS